MGSGSSGGVAALLALAAVWTGPAATVASGQEEVVFVAHRGGIVEGVPENTLAAFRRAIADGVQAIELDLRGTRDGRVVVIHDATVDRTTDGRGAVAELTLSRIRALDAGGGERVPTFEEVLEAVGPSDVGLLLDIKEGATLDTPEVVRLVRRHGAATRVIVGARTLDDVRAFRRLDPSLRVLGFVEDVASVPAFVDEGVDIIRLWPEWIADDPTLVETVHRLGRPVWVTAGDAPRTELARLVRMGVDGILSDSTALSRAGAIEGRSAPR